jgi:hypothetical protein
MSGCSAYEAAMQQAEALASLFASHPAVTEAEPAARGLAR